MDGLTAFGLFAVTAMLAAYAVEEHSPRFIMAFAGTCTLSSGGLLLLWTSLWRARSGIRLEPRPGMSSYLPLGAAPAKSIDERGSRIWIELTEPQTPLPCGQNDRFVETGIGHDNNAIAILME